MNRPWILVFVILLTISVGTTARQVTPEEVDAVASSFFHSQLDDGHRPLSLSGKKESVRGLYSEDGLTVLAYVYELDPVGYVVVTADTDLPPVIAYSLHSDFCWEPAESNILLDLLRRDLSLRMEALDHGCVSAKACARNASSWSSMTMTPVHEQDTTRDIVVGPLLEAPTWSQTAPWNDACPTDPSTGKRSSTGCAATALAQIVSYYRYPSSITFSSSDDYVTLARQIPIDAITASYPDIEYGGKAHHNPSDNSMARLSLAAGISVKMDYASTGSGAYAVDIAIALAGSQAPITSSRRPHPGIWQYKSADIRTCVNSHWGDPFYQTATEFYGGLRDDLDQGRPVVLCILTAGTSTGHILVCDGYETSSSRYHLNLGWGGYSDGWYELPEDMPPGYNIVEYGILNIRPPTTPDDRPGDGDSTTSSTTAFGDVIAYPNPSPADVTFSYTGESAPASMSITVYDLTGRRIWSDEALGAVQIVWDGRDGDGTRPPNGPLLFVAVVSDGMNVSTSKGTLFILR